MLMWLFSVVEREKIIDGCCYWLSETENKGRAQGRVSNEKLTSKYAKNFRIYDTFSDLNLYLCYDPYVGAFPSPLPTG